ncbi:mCG68102, partial [Mus musculus]
GRMLTFHLRVMKDEGGGLGKCGTRRQTSSTAPDLSENEFKKEKERLTTELHLITQKRNEQRDHLIAFKEGSMNKRTQRLQQELKFPQPKKKAYCRMSFHLRSPLLNSIPNIHNLGLILLHSVHLCSVNSRKPVSQLIQGVIPFSVLVTPLE